MMMITRHLLTENIKKNIPHNFIDNLKIGNFLFYDREQWLIVKKYIKKALIP